MVVSFPDGMVVLEGPFPGYETDIMVWRDSEIRTEINDIMEARLAENLPRPRLRLYADKIYNTSLLVVAAWNLRHGPVLAWQAAENRIMSGIRVAFEWTVGTILSLFKFTDFCKGQKIFESPVARHYVMSVLFAN